MDKDILTTLKIVIVGDSGVGKSSLLLRFCENTFESDLSATIGVDFKNKVVSIDGNNVKLALWDTAGAERFKALTPNYYREAQGCILIYDVSNKDSFKELERWLQEVELYSTKKSIIKMLVANKIDIKEKREVSNEEGSQFAYKNHCLFIEASAKTSEGVQCAFEELVQGIIQTPDLWETDNAGFKINQGPIKKKYCGGYCFW